MYMYMCTHAVYSLACFLRIRPSRMPPIAISLFPLCGLIVPMAMCGLGGVEGGGGYGYQGPPSAAMQFTKASRVLINPPLLPVPSILFLTVRPVLSFIFLLLFPLANLI